MAQLYFNQGRLSSNMVLFDAAGLHPSLRLQETSQRSDQKRKASGISSSDPEGKKRRQTLHNTKKQIGFRSDKSHYQSASFHSGSKEFEP